MFSLTEPNLSEELLSILGLLRLVFRTKFFLYDKKIPPRDTNCPFIIYDVLSMLCPKNSKRCSFTVHVFHYVIDETNPVVCCVYTKFCSLPWGITIC